MVIDYIAMDLSTSVPILLAGLGLLLMNRSGLLNIGCEGIMLMGALMAVVGSDWVGSAWFGLLMAMMVGALMGFIFAFLTVSVRANQIVIGTAFNILSLGLSSTINRMTFGVDDTINIVDSFKTLEIPLLSKIPFIGQAFFKHINLVYVAFLLVPLISFFLFKTTTGLNLRSVGEDPRAAETMGVNVYRVRYLASTIGGVLMAMGGAFLATGLLSTFSDDMISGRGYIALAAVIFGRYKPVGVMLAAMLFSVGNVAANALQAQGTGVPYHLLMMIPYVLTVIALAGFTGKVTPPAAVGKPYKRG